MNQRTLRNFGLPVQRLGLALLTAAALYADTTFTLQNGVNGYSGAKDVSIDTQYAEYNGGNGILWRGGAELGCYTTSGSGAYTVRYLLKFVGLPIAAGSRVVSATLTMGLDYWNNGPGNVTGLYLKNSWNPASNRIGWLHRDDTHDWAAAGAAASGVDTIAGKSFQVPRLRPIGPQSVTITLDPAVIQSWIDSPDANQGIMLVNNNVEDIIRPAATTGTQSMRPKLTILVGGAVTGVQVGITPATATLQSGGQQTFTATVTGSSNTAVTWSATGGTISTAGGYTAGNVAGNFMVKATSVADPTRSASAAVTIQAPSVSVSVSVSPTTVNLQPGQTRQFTATVTGSSNTAVVWSATGGTISSAGLYTAGNAAGSFTVKATSAADPTKSGTAAVTIPAPSVSVSVSPTSVNLQPGQTRQFTATVTGSSNTAVTWSCTGGTISAAGLYTAGNAAGNFTVKATSAADATKSATAAVSIQAAAISVSVSPASVGLQPGGTRQFTATVTGSSNQSVNWTATGGTITASGLYTAGQSAGSFSVTAKSVADPSQSATATIAIASAPTLPPVPRQVDGGYVVVQSPVSGMHFTAPATIRIFADPHDSDAPDPDALTVNFFMNGQSVGTFTGSGAHNGYWALTVNNVAAGTYAITGQINTARGTVTSPAVTVFVDNPPASSGPIYNLTADTVLSGSQSVTYAGTPDNHCVLNGNGFQIRSASGFTGSLKIDNCDVRGLGTASKPAIAVTVNGSGSIQLTGNVFDTFGAVNIGTNDQAQAIIRNNEFRENTLVAVGSQPSDTSTETIPVFSATGNSSAQKFFQGNNVGLSTLFFDNTRNWLIGGDTDAESNVLMGVRCGFTINGSTGMVLRGNYSQHNYPHRFSQGENFELVGNGFLAEHNVIRNSSWPVRGFGGEFRYNLVDEGGNSHAAMQSPESNAHIHHNIFLYSISQTFYGADTVMTLLYNVDGLQFHNNVLDGGGPFMMFSGKPIEVTAGSFIGSLRNNVFYNFASLAGQPALAGDLGESTNPPLPRLRYADYNDFYNPAAPNQTNYGLGVVGLAPGAAGYGMHDLGGFNGHMNPKFVQPTAISFPFRAEDIWSRTKKVSDVLAAYRAMYTPAPGSPLIGAGDPQDGQGGNIGAVGNGEAADQFGLFGGGSSSPLPPPPPTAPVIGSFTASPETVQAGQSATLNWSVSDATSLNIAPGPGAVTGNSVTVTPGATTTYTLTATNDGGSATATVTVTVNVATPPPGVSVSVSPATTSIFTGGTQQFTATVTGATNQAITWTATGGTITSAGLY
ncbi:MAG TPA: Ig-like domain-containing protein, partial [Bryobacteraceae bacterium]